MNKCEIMSDQVKALVLGILGAAFAQLPLTSDCAAVSYTGVNLAGADFGEGNLPGTYNVHYTYPTTAEVDYFVDKGMNTFRLPFRWERMQQSQNAALDAPELARLDSIVDYATSQGAYVVLDPHNYARYHGNVIGGGAVPHSAFADFWSRLADEYKDNDRVVFGLMNEPNTMPTEQWRDAANAAIAAIRNTGAANLILVPGNGWTGAHSWAQNWYGTPNATAMLSIVDPLENFAFDVHQYLDHNSSGTSSQIGTNDNLNNVNIGVERLTSLTQWLHANDRRAFLGEFAVANSRIGSGTSGGQPQIGDEALDNMLSYMAANDDVWLGWTWWAAGPWWQNYLFTLEPTNLGQPTQADRPAMAVLEAHFATLLAGDYNDDGAVDAADFVLWRRSLEGFSLPNETASIGIVNEADYEAWRANFNTSPGGGGARFAGGSVPEPSMGVLIGLSLLQLSALLRRGEWPRRGQVDGLGRRSLEQDARMIIQRFPPS
jgi:endoglucanase